MESEINKIVKCAAGLQELWDLSKSISGPSNFTRLQPVGPVQNKICVCFDKRDTYSL